MKLRSIDLLNPQVFQPDGCPHNVNNRIDCTDFMEMNLFDVYPMYLGFRLSQP
ncbi:hypothetical protein SDC9_203405 [bioreactor metagenome]|uniref:Uncharacterized protein n=1 Tax=bioreactor metagenome TaxID=1076179 RepID=A0A645IWK9_9ZZZZ